ncbi:hypothetical protein MKW92_048155 [Papaver armeniacum]|nr:hypothetical protein MKW92_048155 [Papaver armeniacum]
MVDSVVSVAAKKLGDVLISETCFLLGVRSQVKGLRDELIRMQCFLKDADAKEQQGDERVCNWIKEIRDVAYDAEDVIDTFILKVNSTRKTKGIRNLVIRKVLMVKNLIHLHRVGNEILAIQARLKAVSDSTVTYGIKDLEASISGTNQRMIRHPLRNRHPHVEDNDVIGFDEHARTLLTELMKDEKERRVISIVGVGGLGKTTLAKKIYRHDTLKSQFDCCGWSSISQQLNVKDVLGEIMKCMSQVPSGEFQMNEGDLMEKIHKYLQDKRYFVTTFPIGKRGSKVLLTTRNKEVALHADPWSLHFEPKLLSDDDSWELLRRKAFPKNMTDSNCYPARLEKLGREMVRKCGGLPLGICVLGGLLATKRSEIKEWERVHRNVISNINKGENGGVTGILALSYHDLPSHLKPCFLYLGLFPEDYAIPRKKLIQLWIAEDIGKRQYLAELIQRCMVQVGKQSFFQIEKRKHHICRVHDLMRDLCLSKGKEINFLDTYNQQHQIGNVTKSNLNTDTCGRLRRYAINLNAEDMLKRYDIYFNNSYYALRTLLAIIPWGSTRALSGFQNIKLLRVLDLENEEQFDKSMINEVFKLIHLRYLGIRGVSEVSSSIGNLQNLQILKLGTNELLPKTATNLVQLRHLILSRAPVAQNFQLKSLINLQTISLRAGEWIQKGCLGKLPNLQKLDVWHSSLRETNIILEEIVVQKSPLLASSFAGQYHRSPIRSLSIREAEEFPDLIFESLSCCHNLRSLDLRGSLDIVNLQKYPPNLTKLYLKGSSFTKDFMETLQYLPKLRILGLSHCLSKREEMVCSSKGFPELQCLSLYWLENVREWRIDQGGMPHLKELCIDFCSKLSMLPEGLRFITTLKTLKIDRMPLIKERVAEGGDDWYKVQHVPSITIQ